MRRRTQLFLAILACLFTGNLLFAGDEHDKPERQLVLIHKEYVKTGMESQYEAAVVKMIQKLAAHDVSPEKVSWYTVSGPELGYSYVMKIGEKYAGMDTMRANWMAAMDKVGEGEWTELAAAVDECIERRESFIVTRRPELCYTPKNPSDTGDALHLDYSFYFVKPGHEDAAEELGKEYVELYEKHGITTGYSVYASIIGSDLPAYALIYAGESAEALAAEIAEIEATLGAEGEEINNRVMPHVKTVVHMSGTVRPELSYMVTK